MAPTWAGPGLLQVFVGYKANFSWFYKILKETSTLAGIAWTFYMLHGNMQANFLKNLENSGTVHGNIL